MAWIKVIDETEAVGKSRKIYQELKKERGKIANINEGSEFESTCFGSTYEPLS